MAPATDTFTLNVMGLDITVTRATTPDAAPVVQIDSAGVPGDDDGSPLIRVYVNDGCVYEGAEYVSETDAEDACECADDTVPGAIWPIASNGDATHDWVERCDLCCRYESDDDAAIAVAAAMGLRVQYAWRDGHNRVYVEKPA